MYLNLNKFLLELFITYFEETIFKKLTIIFRKFSNFKNNNKNNFCSKVYPIGFNENFLSGFRSSNNQILKNFFLKILMTMVIKLENDNWWSLSSVTIIAIRVSSLCIESCNLTFTVNHLTLQLLPVLSP